MDTSTVSPDHRSYSLALASLAEVLERKAFAPFEEAVEYAARCARELSRHPDSISEEELLDWFDEQAELGDPVDEELDEELLESSRKDIEEGRVEEV